MHCKANEVDGRSQPSTVRIHTSDLHRVGVLPEGVEVGVSAIYLSVIDDFVALAVGQCVPSNLHSSDATRSENVVHHVFCIRLSCHAFDDSSQETIPEVRVGP